MSLDDLHHELLALKAKALESHVWADYRNVVGFVSAIMLRGAEFLDEVNGAPQGAYEAMRDLRASAAALERWAFGPPWDLSQERIRQDLVYSKGCVLNGLKYLKTSDGETCRDDFTVCYSALVGGSACVMQAAIERQQLADPLNALMVGAVCTHLDAAAIAACAQPWRFRDGAPESDQALAFEAALDAGQRTFAYRLFER